MHSPPSTHVSQAYLDPRLRRDDGDFAAVASSQCNVIPAEAGIQARLRACAASLCLAATIALLTPSPATAQMKPGTSGIAPHEIRIDARPIAAFNRSGAPFANAHLAWRGGLTLTSPSSYFGGWSGLALDAAGARFVAVSDSGVWMTGEIAYQDMRPKAVRGARLGAFLNKAGGPLARMRERDAEAIALTAGTPVKGTALVAFEQADRIGVFDIGKDGLGKPTSYLAMPPEAARMRMDGIEALAVLAGGPRKGAVVAFAENPLRGEKAHRGWIWIAGKPHGFTVPGIPGFSITDAASLDDGSVLILERRFRWLEGLRVRLRRLAPDGIRPGGAAEGEILLEADQAQEIDNLEALAVSRALNGDTVVTLMSDNNFNTFLQRTVLLQFTLKDPSGPETAAAKR